MQKTIYLHLGLHKTATTSIQNFLFHNSTQLEKAGLFYPIIELTEKNQTKINLTENIANMRLFFCEEYDFEKFFMPCFYKELQETRQIYKRRFETCFIKKIEESTAKNILFSEGCMAHDFNTTPIFIETLKKFGFDVKIIAYIRPAADWITSLWNNNIKISATRTSLKSYCYRTYDFMALNRLFYFIKILGKENVILRAYEKAQWKNNAIIDDFLDIFALDMSSNMMEESIKEKKNVSPGRNTAEILRLLSYSGSIKFNELNPYLNRLVEIETRMNEKPLTTLESLLDSEILDITERTRHLYTRLANIYGKESFFINEFPSCFGKERPIYASVTINEEQLEIVLEALNKNRQKKDNIIKQLQEENKILLAKK